MLDRNDDNVKIVPERTKRAWRTSSNDNDLIIHFSQELRKEKFPAVSGFQNCGYVSVKKDGEWKYGLKMKLA